MTQLARDAEQLDLNLVYNRTYSKTFTITDSSDLPIDLTTYTAKMQIRDCDTSTLYLELTHSSGIALGGSNGTMAITITDEQTEAFTFEVANYDLVLIAGGVHLDVLYGQVVMHEDITQL